MDTPDRMKILLALSSSRFSREAVQYALDLAKSKKGKIFLVYVVEEETPNKIADYVSEMGFMGDKTAEILKKSLMEEYRERGTEEVADFKKLCERESIPFKEQFCSGRFSEEVLKIVEEVHPETVVLNKREDRSDLERWVFGSEVEKIKKSTKCQVKVIQT